MRIGKIAGVCAGAALLVAVFHTAPAAAQVSASDGAAFAGKWSLSFEPMGGPDGRPQAGMAPQGERRSPGGGAGGGQRGPGGPMMGGGQTIEITVVDNQLAATAAGPMGGEVTVTEISKDGASLVLTYEMGMRDRSMPIVLRLTPDGTAMKAEMQVTGMGGQEMTRSGSATKQ